MGVWRKWVFPVLRILVFGAIAVALVKLAFFADPSADEVPASPTGSITDPLYTVTTGTILNDVSLQGVVEADPAVAVKSVAAGTVDEIFVGQGATVAQGDPLFDVKVETPRDPVETVNPDGSVSVEQPKPTISFVQVLAPASGRLSTLSVIPGQVVAVGDTSGQVTPPSFSVTGSIEPAQQYRLVQRPSEATVSIAGGPAPFTCTGLTISAGTADAPAPDPGELPGADAGAGAGGTTVRCAVPAEVTVFAGLSAEVTIPAGKAENVLVIPTTAVEGGAATGVVYLTGPDGGQEKRDVALGLSDGTNVEVTDGLEEGESILQFTPSAVGPAADGCVPDGSGALICPDGSVIVP